jgi:hypothetical protein
MAGYTKEFLVDAFVSRYSTTFKSAIERAEFTEKLGNSFYDKVGRDKFRSYCSLDAEAIKQYKKELNA